MVGSWPQRLALVLLLAAGWPGPATAGNGRLSIDPIWDDGQAEVAIYAARGPRYGVDRDYEVVQILVKEPFDDALGVKSADRTATAAIKLNLLVTLRTGIYTYRQMLSIFHRRSDLAPRKVAFSSQEWCGTTFKQWRDRGAESRLETRSYFEGEGDRDFALPMVEGLAFEDGLAVILREDATARSVRLVPSLIDSHAPQVVPEVAKIEPQGEPAPVETAAGVRLAREVRVVRGDRIDRLWLSPDDGLLLRWDHPNGHSWRLKQVRRLPYWQFVRPGDEEILRTQDGGAADESAGGRPGGAE